MTKYYRVIKDTFLWEKDAILKEMDTQAGETRGYDALEDVWNIVEDPDWIMATTVEAKANSKWFERVYPDSVTGKIFKTAEQLKKTYSESFKK